MRWGESPWSSPNPCAGAAGQCPRCENCAAGACPLAPCQGTEQGLGGPWGCARGRRWSHPRAEGESQRGASSPAPLSPGLGDDAGRMGDGGRCVLRGHAGGMRAVPVELDWLLGGEGEAGGSRA